MATPDERPLRRQFKAWWESREAQRALPHQKELFFKAFKAGFQMQQTTEQPQEQEIATLQLG